MAVDHDAEAVVGSMPEVICKARHIPRHLLGHTANIHAGAAEWSVLYHRDSRAILCRTACVRNAATTAADYQDIILIVQLSASL